jgi:hypothetical protein
MQVGKFLLLALITFALFCAASAEAGAQKSTKSKLGYVLKAVVGSAMITAQLKARSAHTSNIKKTIRAGLKQDQSSNDIATKKRFDSWLNVLKKCGVVVKKTGDKISTRVSTRRIVGKYAKLSVADKALVRQYKILFGKLHAHFGQTGAAFSMGFGAFLAGNDGLKFAQIITDLTNGVSRKGAFKKFTHEEKKTWSKKIVKLIGAPFFKKFKGSNNNFQIIMKTLKKQVAKQENALVKIQTAFIAPTVQLKVVPQVPSEKEGGAHWQRDPTSGSNDANKNVKTVKRNFKCSCEKIEGGNRRVCCAWRTECVGTGKSRVCKEVQKNCHTKKIWIDKRSYTCQWHKRDAKTHQQRCCLQVISCCGKVCKTTTPNCEWRGRKLTTEFHRGCLWKPNGKHSRQKQCCDTKRVCQGDKCQEVRFGCRWSGKALSSFVEEKCKWIKQTATSTRRKCCRNRVSCIEKECKRTKIGCKWTSQVVTRKEKRRCEWRRYQDGKRLRCCSWISSCAKHASSPIKCLHHRL